MSYALKVANKGNVALVCKTTLEDANTFFAQGGVVAYVAYRFNYRWYFAREQLA